MYIYICICVCIVCSMCSMAVVAQALAATKHTCRKAGRSSSKAAMALSSWSEGLCFLERLQLPLLCLGVVTLLHMLWSACKSLKQKLSGRSETVQTAAKMEDEAQVKQQIDLKLQQINSKLDTLANEGQEIVQRRSTPLPEAVYAVPVAGRGYHLSSQCWHLKNAQNVVKYSVCKDCSNALPDTVYAVQSGVYLHSMQCHADSQCTHFKKVKKAMQVQYELKNVQLEYKLCKDCLKKPGEGSV